MATDLRATRALCMGLLATASLVAALPGAAAVQGMPLPADPSLGTLPGAQPALPDPLDIATACWPRPIEDCMRFLLPREVIPGDLPEVFRLDPGSIVPPPYVEPIVPLARCLDAFDAACFRDGAFRAVDEVLSNLRGN